MPQNGVFVYAEVRHQACNIGRQSLPVVAGWSLCGLSVSPLVGGDNPELLGQLRRNEIVPMGARRQPVERENRSAVTSPVQVSHAQIADVRPFFTGRRGGFGHISGSLVLGASISELN